MPFVVDEEVPTILVIWDSAPMGTRMPKAPVAAARRVARHALSARDPLSTAARRRSKAPLPAARRARATTPPGAHNGSLPPFSDASRRRNRGWIAGPPVSQISVAGTTPGRGAHGLRVVVGLQWFQIGDDVRRDHPFRDRPDGCDLCPVGILSRTPRRGLHLRSELGGRASAAAGRRGVNAPDNFCPNSRCSRSSTRWASVPASDVWLLNRSRSPAASRMRQHTSGFGSGKLEAIARGVVRFRCASRSPGGPRVPHRDAVRDSRWSTRSPSSVACGRVGRHARPRASTRQSGCGRSL
jgi:hypothetical protein